jgi:hypothetical protein
VTGADETPEPAEPVEPIVASPTANPTRVQVPPEGPAALTGQGEDPAEPGPPPGEET